MDVAASKTHILAIDHGTSGIKTSLVSARGEIIATESEPSQTIHLVGGGVEQDAQAWWRSLVSTARRLVEKNLVNRASIRAVAVSSTFSSTVAVDRQGLPVAPAIMWMDMRGAPYVRQMMRGWPRFDGYGVARLLRWIRITGGAPTLTGKDDIGHALLIQHEFPEVYRATAKFLPSKDYLNARLTGRLVAGFDSIQLFWLTDTRDISRVRYHPGLVQLSGLDQDKLPELISAMDIVGPLLPEVAASIGLEESAVVVGGAPDHQAAGLGSGAVDDFDAHLYFGTSSWIQCAVPFKKTDALHSIASLPMCVPGRYYCANEQDMAGGCLEFLLKNLLLPPDGLTAVAVPDDAYARLETMAARIAPGSDGVIFCPWLNGERTPVDDANLRGAFVNLSNTTEQAHLVRAVLEGVAYNTRWSLSYVERFLGRRLPKLNFIGGGAISDTWCQILADVLGRPIWRVAEPRAANARGVALLASAALGQIGFRDIGGLVPIERRFEPDGSQRGLYDRMYAAFIAIYRQNRRTYARLNGGRDS